VLLGSIAGRYNSFDTYWFAAGASSFSLIWFLTISYGARALTPLFANPLAWRILDCLVAITMWTIAYLLLTDSLGK
jgi:L-lysine exporter family protein LysE/ArgO